jgi:hypothetical protein
MTQLDETLIYRLKRRARDDGLTQDETIAVNLLWRRGVRVAILCEVFNVGKNTIYYKCCTGDADSYPNGRRKNTARDTNDLIDSLGVDEAERRFLTDDIKARVNEASERELRRRELNSRR